MFLSPSIYDSFAQEEEQIQYYQMEPLDDSLFIQIQQEVFIDPPDPKAELIVDLRDPNNQTITIKGALYPFLALSPETRARIITYPFKINLEDEIHYGSVFTNVIEKIRLGKIIEPPSKQQIAPTLNYINPFLQLFGGERLGIPLKKDIGISMGLGTPYSGPLETNFIEVNFHILGFYGGGYGRIDELTNLRSTNIHNNLYATFGYQIGYVVPFGNFFEVSFLKNMNDVVYGTGEYDEEFFTRGDTANYRAYIIQEEYINWEFRYPLRVLGSTRAKIYAGKYLNEWHIGFTGRELSLAGSTFDFRFDAMFNSPVRQDQFVIDIMVQKIAESWGFSAFAIGPSAIISKDVEGNFGFITVFANFRFKLGTSF
ncbi:MAG: hypothetical protein Kow0098_14510 [Ignavibacteriaceae bacterium]